MMTIAIPYEDGQVFQHFGHTEQFMLYKIDHGRVVSSALLPTGEAHCGGLAVLLASNGVDTLVCGNLGGGARAACENAGLMIFPGVVGNAEEAARAFADGTLRFDSNAGCAGHGDHCKHDAHNEHDAHDGHCCH